MKKIICIFLAIVLIFSFAACAKSPAKEGSTDKSETATANTTTDETEKGNDTADANTAASPADSQAGLKVGFSLPSMTFPFYVRMYDQIMVEAEARGWDVSFVDGNLDAGTQLNGLQDMINNNVDIMIIATWYIDALADIFTQCGEKGIPVFLMDNMTIPEGQEKNITFTTGTDNYNAGVVGGTWYADYLSKNGISSIKMITVSATSIQQVSRCDGFSDALKEHGISVEILNTYDGGKRETAMAASEDALTAYKDLNLIYGASAQDSLGAYDATAGANRSEVQVFGFDGEDEELANIDKGANYIATITQDPAGQAKLVAEKVDLWVGGTTFDQKEETPAGVYCADGQLTGAEILGN